MSPCCGNFVNFSFCTYRSDVAQHYRVVNYNGALDIICHYPGTEDMYSRTEWAGRAEFQRSVRAGWWVRHPTTGASELAGFVKRGGNLRLVLVRNAGHSVPINQPLWALRREFCHHLNCTSQAKPKLGRTLFKKHHQDHHTTHHKSYPK